MDVSLRFPCILFGLNLVTATYISAFLQHKGRNLAPKDKLECIPFKGCFFHDKSVPVTNTAWHDRPQIWRVAANILYKQSWRAEKR
jgi:hypothetical protein